PAASSFIIPNQLRGNGITEQTSIPGGFSNPPPGHASLHRRSRETEPGIRKARASGKHPGSPDFPNSIIILTVCFNSEVFLYFIEVLLLVFVNPMFHVTLHAPETKKGSSWGM
ncbi:hypothetical protein, partial [Gluconobacter oxydans]